MGICCCSAITFTASRNFSVTCPSTTGEGIGLPSCSRINVTNPPDVASGPMYPFRYNRSRHSTSNVTCPFSSSGILAIPSILCPDRVAFLASWRLGERLKKAAMTENTIAREIVDAAFRIHTTLGPGLLESVYDAVLAYELAQRGLQTVSQQAIPVVYGTIRIDIGFRADLIVEDRVIVEIKSVEALAPVHKKQLLTYLRLADKRLGLLINFHVAFIKEGIARVVNGLEEDSHAKSPSRKGA